MRINNNIMAMNTHRQYSINTANVAKSTEKLSSGYRINRAGDDAAGLAISEKMRAQIRGLTMASKNSSDAISMVQTAEGALQSSHNILQRMRELAVQSASDTNEQTIDRAALDQEFQQLKAEINDIATKTRFNDQNLIDGTFSKSTAQIAGTAIGVELGSGLTSRISATGEAYGQWAFAVTGIDASAQSTSSGTAATGTVNATAGANGAIGVATWTGPASSKFNNNDYMIKTIDLGGGDVKFQILDSSNNVTAESQVMAYSDFANVAAKSVDINLGSFGTLKVAVLANSTAANANSDLNAATFNGTKVEVGAVGVDPVISSAKTAGANITLNGETLSVKKGDTSVTFKETGVTLYFDGGLRDSDLGTTGTLAGTDFNAKTVSVSALPGKSFVVQSGANEGDELAINIENMNAVSLGIEGSSILNRTMASSAITEVNDAINRVSTQRAALGALQNRLDYKIANLDTSAENLTAAESRIRDLDMAKEMTNFTKNNILVQASTAMLAQANAAPQGVLQLLG